jgi:hypothetical protein
VSTKNHTLYSFSKAKFYRWILFNCCLKQLQPCGPVGEAHTQTQAMRQWRVVFNRLLSLPWLKAQVAHVSEKRSPRDSRGCHVAGTTCGTPDRSIDLKFHHSRNDRLSHYWRCSVCWRSTGANLASRVKWAVLNRTRHNVAISMTDQTRFYKKPIGTYAKTRHMPAAVPMVAVR